MMVFSRLQSAVSPLDVTKSYRLLQHKITAICINRNTSFVLCVCVKCVVNTNTAGQLFFGDSERCSSRSTDPSNEEKLVLRETMFCFHKEYSLQNSFTS